AMSRPAADNGHQVRLVGTPLDRDIITAVKACREHPTLRRRLSESLAAYYAEELPEALPGSDLVIGGISSFGVEWFAKTVLPQLPGGITVLSITKGLQAYSDGCLESFPGYLETLRPDLEFLAVGGPCICFELMDRRHTMVCFCGKNIAAVQRVCKLLATPYYHIIPTDDVIGIECGAAMKNAYAMGVALAVGLAEREKGIAGAEGITADCVPGAPDLNPVYNPQAALFAQSCREMYRLVEMLGGNPEQICGLAGAGDLYVTVFGGRTRRLGTLLGRGMNYPEVREVLSGVTLEAAAVITRVAAALRTRAAAGEIDLKRFPLLMQMDAIINNGSAAELDWNGFSASIFIEDRKRCTLN
ncbi:MAG: hypothetical protein PHV59_12490, partial [Victivallales bacterium]|nr:hypothetical protein [Victivallales bacterium]